jgi:hypothetical protein
MNLINSHRLSSFTLHCVCNNSTAATTNSEFDCIKILKLDNISLIKQI